VKTTAHIICSEAPKLQKELQHGVPFEKAGQTSMAFSPARPELLSIAKASLVAQHGSGEPGFPPAHVDMTPGITITAANATPGLLTTG